MTNLDLNKMNYARALIRAGVARDLILKITSISNYQYAQIQRELLAYAKRVDEADEKAAQLISSN